eukprot:jgi/Astpho2/4894/e_gw1.00069.48.1_t
MHVFHLQNAKNITYALSRQPWYEYAGGWAKFASVQEFPYSSKISGSLVELKPGGLRELHWHVPNEWAIVINGTCRATIAEQGAGREVDSWDFHVGDVWYFPSNLGHAVLGLEAGCTFVAGYDDGDFDEPSTAFGLGNWLTTAPPKIVAQVRCLPAIQVLTGQCPQPILMYPCHVHLLDLQVQTSGGTVLKAAAVDFPISQEMAAALASLQLHWHPTMDEWQYLINGTMTAGTFNGPGQVSGPATLHAGDLGYAPRGSAHWLHNEDIEPLLSSYGMQQEQRYTVDADVEVTNWMGALPADYTALSLNATLEFVAEVDLERKGMVAGSPDIAAQRCRLCMQQLELQAI